MSEDTNQLIRDLKRFPQDITVVCSDGSFAVSSMLIKMRSDYARAMFDGGFAESTSKEIKLSDVNTTVAKILFNYLQFAESDVRLSIDDAIGVYQLADRHMVERLKEISLNILKLFARDPEYCIETYHKCKDHTEFAHIETCAYHTYRKYINKRKNMYYCVDCDFKQPITVTCEKCGEELSVLSPNECCRKGHTIECEYPKCKDCGGDVVVKTYKLFVSDNTPPEIVHELFKKHTIDL